MVLEFELNISFTVCNKNGNNFKTTCVPRNLKPVLKRLGIRLSKTVLTETKSRGTFQIFMVKKCVIFGLCFCLVEYKTLLDNFSNYKTS